MQVFREFRAFIARGNLMDLAIGIMIGAAFNSIVQSLVKDILTPLIGIFTGRADMSQWKLSFEVPGPVGDAESQLVELTYGNFLQAAMDFIILAFVIFCIVKFISRLKKKAEDVENTEVPTPKDILILSEIRDLLKDQSRASTL